MDKIYSRKRIRLPRLNLKYVNVNGNKHSLNNNEKNKIKLLFLVIFVLVIAFSSAYVIINAITPIIDRKCSNIAKSIATRVSNEQATIVMNNYKYQDLCDITKDGNRKY